MKRFNGRMPATEIKATKTYKDKYGLKITIEAGIHGWTILYADGSTTYKDQTTSTEENFINALRTLKAHFPDLKEDTSTPLYDIITPRFDKYDEGF